MEATLVPKHGIEIDFIEISGLRGKGVAALLKAPFAIFKAVMQARKIIKIISLMRCWEWAVMCPVRAVLRLNYVACR